MSIGIFTNKNHQPTTDEIQATIGSKFSIWQELIQIIRDKYSPDEDIKFIYGAKYGWALRFRIKDKLLGALYPTTGGFTVQLILAPDAIEQALQMMLCEKIQHIIENAKPYPEGRWLFIPVESKEGLRDIQRLFALRFESKIKTKR
jgi:hypothetical protein